MRRVLAAFVEQGVRVNLGFYTGLLAQLEVETTGADGALARLDEAFRLSDQVEHRCSLPFLHRLRGEILLKRDPADLTSAEEAFRTSIAVAKEQGARSPVLLASLVLAKLLQSTSRPIEAHALLAPALEGFSPTSEMPEIAEAQALAAALTESEEVKAAEARRQRRLHLQTAYGKAMMWSKGYAAEDTKAAFARAAEFTERTDNFSDRVVALQGQFSAAATAGELRSARELVLTLLREAEDAGQPTEAIMADNFLGLVAYWRGDFVEARTCYERALAAADPNHDPQFVAYGALASAHLAATMWQLGEVERARDLINSAIQRASETGYFGAIADTLFYKSYMEIWRGDPLAALSAAEALERVARERGMVQYLNEAELHSGWARGRINDPLAGAAQVRRVLAALVNQGVRINLGFYTGLLAELEAETLGAESALARIDEAFRLSNQVEHHCSLPFLHRLRGEILLNGIPSSPAPAEEAFQTALGIAKQQGARSWGLRAALSLAKLYQSTARPVDAHAVLAPALEGFSPTLEMPEIAEGQAVLAALADTDEVKAAAATRRRRLKLQTDYSRALLWSKGFSAGETSAALADASKLAAGKADFAARFAGYYGAWIGSLSRGDLAKARQVSETFAREAKGEAHAPSLARACLCLGVTSFVQGEFAGAGAELEEALRTYDPSWDRDDKLGLWPDAGVIATAFLAKVSWLVGEVARAKELIEQAVACAIQSEDVPSKVNVYVRQAALEAIRGDAEAVLPVAGTLVELSQEYGLTQWLAWGNTFRGWAKSRLGGRDVGVTEMQDGIAVLAEQESKLHMPLIHALLAEIEAEMGESALSRIDGALALARETGEHWSDSFLHRLRSNILLKLDPANMAAAEQALRAAIAVAQTQKARSFELQAALGLARIYQLTARPADAREVLSSALEGFSPTPEMPEIAEAQALLESLAHGGEEAIASKDQPTQG
jgi:predicted ATPase